MSKKVDFAEMDVRIRRRRTDWNKSDSEALEKGLSKLPDLAEEVVAITIPQPALAQPESDEEAPAEGDDGAAS
jgi:hypothetical protein